MNRKLCRLLTLAGLLAVGGCVYQPVVVSPQTTVEQRFDRAWSAVSGAMYDQGLAITVQDRAAGIIRGERAAPPSRPRSRRWPTAASK